MEVSREKTAKTDWNEKKNTNKPSTAPLYSNVAGDMVEVVTGKGAHKYVGKLVPGDWKQRTQIDYEHKIRLAWATIH